MLKPLCWCCQKHIEMFGPFWRVPESRKGTFLWKYARAPESSFLGPLRWYVFHQPLVSLLCFPCRCQKTDQTRSSFGGNQKVSGGGDVWFRSPCDTPGTLIYTQNDYRTEIYYFRIIFGNSCSVITEPNCFWNYLVSVRKGSRGLPNPLPNCFGNNVR